MGQLVAIVSQKGGVGKTATAVNLGACLSAIKRKVLLIEMDPQSGLGECFGLRDSNASGLLDAIRDGTPVRDVIYQSHRRLPRLDVMPVNVQNTADEAQLLGILDGNLGSLIQVVEMVRPSYDFIFIDCPPRLDNPTQAALAVADSYLVPVQCEYASMGTVGSVLRAAREIKRMGNSKLAIFGFLITMADKKARFTVKVIQEVRQYLKDRVFKTVIPRDPRLAEVVYRQEPVIAYDLETPGAKAYVRLAREILAGLNTTRGSTR